MTDIHFPPPAVILVGHGSDTVPEALQPLMSVAEQVAALGKFSEVRAVFMRGQPAACPPETLVAAKTIIVVPMFMGRGHYTDVLVPRALGLNADGRAERAGRIILTTPPVGTHPAMPDLVAARAAEAATQAGLHLADSTVYLVAHGSTRPGGSGETAKAILSGVRGTRACPRVQLGFLEQEPLAQHWRTTVPTGPLVVVPLLAAPGAHASRDIPALFGFAPHGPDVTWDQGRKVVLAAVQGTESRLAGLVADLAINEWMAYADCNHE